MVSVLFFEGSPPQDMHLLEMRCHESRQSHSRGRTRTFWEVVAQQCGHINDINDLIYTVLFCFGERLTAGCRQIKRLF